MKIIADPGIVTYRDTVRLNTREGRRTSVGVRISRGLEGKDFTNGFVSASIVKMLNSGIPHVNYALIDGITDADDLGVYDVCYGADEEITLVFYFAQHPRQRIQIEESNVLQLLVCGCYGAGVVAVMEPDDTLIFRNRQFKETVFFDGDRLVVTTREEEEHVDRV